MSNKRKLLRLTESLHSQPHLISQAGFKAISHYLDSRNKYGLMNFDMPDEGDEQEDTPDDLDDFDPVSGVGVIEICGPLTYKATGWEALCGGCSYESILDQADSMIEAGAKTLILNCDSGGGEAYGCFETGNELRKMCDDAGVYLVAYNDGCMASACYALAVVADEVISNPSAETGSIGVLVALMNDSKHLEQEGYTRTFISAGEQKIPFADDGSFKKEFLADLQMKVDSMYADFVAHVTKYTMLSAEDVKNTQAKTFLASDALSLGLVNKVMTRSEFINYIVNKQKEL